MEISICAATQLELTPLQSMIPSLEATGHRFRYCITGIGMLQSCFYIQQHLLQYRPQFLLQIGIAGCFDHRIPLGSVIAVEKEYLGSLGVVENKAAVHGWQDIFDLGLQNAMEAPFDDKALVNPSISGWRWLQRAGVITGTAVTIDEISTSHERILTLEDRYQPILESMEGAALHFNGLMYQVPFLQIRGISNYTGERDKTKWQIGPALQAVSKQAVQFIRGL